jgi:hypothetical protein
MSYQFNDPVLEAIFLRRQRVAPGRSLELEWEKTSWRRIFSRHNVDLAVGAVPYVIILAAAAVVIANYAISTPKVDGIPGLPIIFGSAVFGAFFELLRRTYDAAVKRVATIDLFTSEMLSIMRVFAAANIIGHFARLYDKTTKPPELGMAAPPGPEPAATGLPATSLKDAAMPSGFADVARKESYFSIFERNAAELGTLDPAATNNITAFYTFLKSSRDATESIAKWQLPHYETFMKQEDVITVIYLCFLMTRHGMLALGTLTSSEKNLRIIDDIFAGVYLQCFHFLDHVVSPDDYRRWRVDERREVALRLARDYSYDLAAAPPADSSG